MEGCYLDHARRSSGGDAEQGGGWHIQRGRAGAKRQGGGGCHENIMLHKAHTTVYLTRILYRNRLVKPSRSTRRKVTSPNDFASHFFACLISSCAW